MKKLILVLTIAAAITAGCSSDSEETAAVGSSTTEEAEHGDDAKHSDGDGHDHHHDEVLNVPDSMEIPNVEITATADDLGGHIIQVELESFEISAKNASTDPVDGQGHMHLYIDGERVKRFYNTTLYVDGLSEGEHAIEVELSANNHAAYAVDNQPIKAGAAIEVVDSVFEGTEEPIESGASIEISVVEDPLSGYNVELNVDGFEFASGSSSKSDSADTGWVELAIDGETHELLFGKDAHIKLGDTGDYEITATLISESNVQMIDSENGEPISATQTVTVDDKDEDGHNHSEDDSHDHEMDDMDDMEMSDES